MPLFGAQFAQPYLLVGGQLFTDLANLIVLYASASGSATTDKSTFRLPNASSGYQVPASRTLRIYAARARIFATAAGGAGMFNILYGDADVGNAGNTAFTNPVYRGGVNINSQIGNKSSVSSPGNAMFEEAFLFDVPTGKYPSTQCLDTANPANIIIFGYLY